MLFDSKSVLFLKKNVFSKNIIIMFWKWLKISDDGSFGVTVVFVKESRGIRILLNVVRSTQIFNDILYKNSHLS